MGSWHSEYGKQSICNHTIQSALGVQSLVIFGGKLYFLPHHNEQLLSIL